MARALGMGGGQNFVVYLPLAAHADVMAAGITGFWRMGVLARCSTYRGQQPHRSQPSAPTRLLDQAPTPAAPCTAASRGGAQGQQARDPEGKIHRGSKMTTQSTQ